MRRALSLLASGILAAVAVIQVAPATAQPADAPRRVVSINLCADQLLLALADPEQIASLSVNATDPVLSFAAEAARLHRHDAADAESVIALDPDLVLAGAFTRSETRDMLRRLGYRVVDLDVVESIDQAVAQVREVASLLGHPDRGEALAGLIDYAKAQANRPHPGIEPPSVLVYQRRGYVTGSRSMASDLVAAVGLRDLGPQLVGDYGGFVALERIVQSPPDYLVVADADPELVDQGIALLEHPALVRLFPPARRLELPERLTVCSGPSLPEALRFLSGEVRRLGL